MVTQWKVWGLDEPFFQPSGGEGSSARFLEVPAAQETDGVGGNTWHWDTLTKGLEDKMS